MLIFRGHRGGLDFPESTFFLTPEPLEVLQLKLDLVNKIALGTFFSLESHRSETSGHG